MSNCRPQRMEPPHERSGYRTTIENAIGHLIEPYENVTRGNVISQLGISAKQDKPDFQGVAHYDAEQIRTRDTSSFGRREDPYEVGS